VGKNNRQRRAAKAKARARKGRTRNGRTDDGWYWSAGEGHDPFDPPRSDRDRVVALIGLEQLARSNGDELARAKASAQLAASPPAVVARELEREIARIVPMLWDGGWLPGELLRQTRRATTVSGERLCRFAVAADHQRRDSSTLHPRWRLHLDELELPPVAGIDGWLRSTGLSRSLTAPVDWPALIELALDVAYAMGSLHRLAEVIPPPGSKGATGSMIDLTGKGADPVLAKVRALLAQAESTDFDAEAETFTAKAQELMARHSLDAAMVWANDDRNEKPRTIRVPLDDPYMDAKGLLVTVVADTSRCRAVLDTTYGLASIVGFENDLVWCETMFTSLLVQAQHELARAGASDQAGGRRRSRSFRSSFLISYAHRIGERLEEVNAHVQDAALDAGDDQNGEQGSLFDQQASSALVPVLAERRSAIDDAIDAQFGRLYKGRSLGVNDTLGWNAGRQAADRAHLSDGRLEPAADTR
jgi:hypothetical protein